MTPGRPVHLPDGNVLPASIAQADVHHEPGKRWFAGFEGGFATCPITRGTLLRLTLRLSGRSTEQALEVLASFDQGLVALHPDVGVAVAA